MHLFTLLRPSPKGLKHHGLILSIIVVQSVYQVSTESIANFSICEKVISQMRCSVLFLTLTSAVRDAPSIVRYIKLCWGSFIFALDSNLTVVAPGGFNNYWHKHANKL